MMKSIQATILLSLFLAATSCGTKEKNTVNHHHHENNQTSPAEQGPESSNNQNGDGPQGIRTGAGGDAVVCTQKNNQKKFRVLLLDTLKYLPENAKIKLPANAKNVSEILKVLNRRLAAVDENLFIPKEEIAKYQKAIDNYATDKSANSVGLEFLNYDPNPQENQGELNDIPDANLPLKITSYCKKNEKAALIQIARHAEDYLPDLPVFSIDYAWYRHMTVQQQGLLLSHEILIKQFRLNGLPFTDNATEDVQYINAQIAGDRFGSGEEAIERYTEQFLRRRGLINKKTYLFAGRDGRGFSGTNIHLSGDIGGNFGSTHRYDLSQKSKVIMLEKYHPTKFVKFYSAKNYQFNTTWALSINDFSPRTGNFKIKALSYAVGTATGNMDYWGLSEEDLSHEKIAPTAYWVAGENSLQIPIVNGYKSESIQFQVNRSLNSFDSGKPSYQNGRPDFMISTTSYAPNVWFNRHQLIEVQLNHQKDIRETLKNGIRIPESSRIKLGFRWNNSEPKWGSVTGKDFMHSFFFQEIVITEPQVITSLEQNEETGSYSIVEIEVGEKDKCTMVTLDYKVHVPLASEVDVSITGYSVVETKTVDDNLCQSN